MTGKSAVFWQHPNRFLLSTAAGLLFLLLTLPAMWLYPGSTINDPTTTGYLFFRNFFSDLGRLTTYSGVDNWPSAVLFISALSTAGAALLLFFVSAPTLFDGRARWAAWLGSAAGVFCGLSFIGIAWTPADRLLDLHVRFVFWAFEAYLVAVLCYTVAIWLQRDYPRRYAVVYLLFAVTLGGYLWLLFNGPSAQSAQGLMIQATGQKIVAYAAIVCMAIQGVGAQQFARRTRSAVGTRPEMHAPTQ